MHSFKDLLGREWPLVITVDAVKRVKDIAGVDLLAIGNGELYTRLADDPIALVDVLWALVTPQAQEQKITPELFAQGLGGDVLDLASTAFLEELIAFFPSRRRAVLTKAMQKALQIEDLASRRALIKLDALDPEKMLESIPGAGSTSSPAPSVSIPVR